VVALRQKLAAKAYGRTAVYDAAISNWFARELNDPTPPYRAFGGKLAEPLRYGENPHQSAAFYRVPERRPGVASARQVQGKQLSYNNINDTDAAYECVAEFDPKRTAACVIVKHANPCGVAEGASLLDAYRKALACDPVSAFGGIVAFNLPLDAEAARAVTEIFTEVIIAPDASDDAVAIVGAKKNLRLLLAGALPDPRAGGLVVKSVAGGLLVQSRDNAVVDDLQLDLVTKRAPTDAELRDLAFAFRVAKHVKSNTIVYAKDCATVGIGAGQMSRIDAARIAARKAEDAAKEAKLAAPLTKGSVVASDAFFPFADGLLVAIEAGATAVIQPGGSMRDDEVIKAANDHGIAMVFTGTRHFRH
jgi:phosphoribosylaminoimidazolecarboxamide formyltransferase/IMP cyclohydrolase